MAGAPTPEFLPEPFANDAPVGAAPGDKTLPIPDAPGSPLNAASWQLGFPTVTMQPETGGGLPPLGMDFNGILFTITSHIFALEAGQPYTFSATLAGTIGGYALGSLLGMADQSGFWFNIQNANSANPDTAAALAGWVPGFSYGISNVAGLVGGLVTLTPAQWRRRVIVLSGVLTSNLTVILPPTLQDWLIVNSTTGAFSTTVQTQGGTGVTVPQGGPGSPTQVWGDGTNIYNRVAPLAVSFDQNPTPLTLVQRTNSGYVFATYFNQNSAYENPTLSGIWIEANGDGYHRKITPANFTAQLFASPTFTGIPRAPTAAAGTSTTQLATTAFVNPGVSGGAIGWEKRPSGMVEQWGSFNKISSAQNVNVGFPIAFPTECVGVWMQETGGNSNNPNGWIQRIVGGSITAAGFTVSGDDFGAGAPSPTITVYWRALGF